MFIAQNTPFGCATARAEKFSFYESALILPAVRAYKAIIRLYPYPGGEYLPNTYVFTYLPYNM